jgi:hypothetical protein
LYFGTETSEKIDFITSWEASETVSDVQRAGSCFIYPRQKMVTLKHEQINVLLVTTVENEENYGAAAGTSLMVACVTFAVRHPNVLKLLISTQFSTGPFYCN